MNASLEPIICCGFTPCIQRTIEFQRLGKGEVNRASRVTIGMGGKGANTARMLWKSLRRKTPVYIANSPELILSGFQA